MRGLIQEAGDQGLHSRGSGGCTASAHQHHPSLERGGRADKKLGGHGTGDGGRGDGAWWGGVCGEGKKPEDDAKTPGLGFGLGN